MFATSGDILNISLALGFIVLVIFVCIFIFYGILVLRDISKITEDAAEVVDRVKSTLFKPLNAAEYIFEKLSPYIESVVESISKKRK